MPDDFDFDAYIFWEQRRSSIQNKLALALTGIIGFVYFYWASNRFTEMTNIAENSIFPFMIIGGGGSTIAATIIMNKLMPDIWGKSVNNHRHAVLRYEKEKKDWEDRRLESGYNYWREMRGIAFEQAVKDFLSRRGAIVEMTKGSGDGGVDLIVTLGRATYWAQCKGHAKPVSVAPIREIAGVCSRSHGKPIVFAVNGYTRSAIATAQDLGVILFDTHHLVEMSKVMRIGDLNPHALLQDVHSKAQNL